MRIAILTDIHGNYVALEACLKHAKDQKINCEWIKPLPIALAGA